MRHVQVWRVESRATMYASVIQIICYWQIGAVVDIPIYQLYLYTWLNVVILQMLIYKLLNVYDGNTDPVTETTIVHA